MPRQGQRPSHDSQELRQSLKVLRYIMCSTWVYGKPILQKGLIGRTMSPNANEVPFPSCEHSCVLLAEDSRGLRKYSQQKKTRSYRSPKASATLKIARKMSA